VDGLKRQFDPGVGPVGRGVDGPDREVEAVVVGDDPGVYDPVDRGLQRGGVVEDVVTPIRRVVEMDREDGLRHPRRVAPRHFVRRVRPHQTVGGLVFGVGSPVGPFVG
jgi:hypothetical protein